MKIKRFKRRAYLKFREKQRVTLKGKQYILVADAWAGMMQIRLKSNIADTNPTGLFDRIEEEIQIRFSPFERAFIASILIRYWRHGRKLKKWYTQQTDYSKTKLITRE